MKAQEYVLAHWSWALAYWWKWLLNLFLIISGKKTTGIQGFSFGNLFLEKNFLFG